MERELATIRTYRNNATVFYKGCSFDLQFDWLHEIPFDSAEEAYEQAKEDLTEIIPDAKNFMDIVAALYISYARFVR